MGLRGRIQQGTISELCEYVSASEHGWSENEQVGHAVCQTHELSVMWGVLSSRPLCSVDSAGVTGGIWLARDCRCRRRYLCILPQNKVERSDM